MAGMVLPRWAFQRITYLFAHCVTLWRNAWEADPGTGRGVEAEGLKLVSPATTAETVADYLVWHSQEHGDPLTNLKLQKLLYYAFGWYLVLHHRPLFGESMKAWVRGPVVPSVWHKYRAFAWQPITTPTLKPHSSRALASAGRRPRARGNAISERTQPGPRA